MGPSPRQGGTPREPLQPHQAEGTYALGPTALVHADAPTAPASLEVSYLHHPLGFGALSQQASYLR